MYNVTAYIIYLACSLTVVLWVGRILHRNGKAYLFEECPDRHISEAANNLLYAGYCLLNAGFAFYDLDTCKTLTGFQDLVEFIASAEGFILLVLGLMHVANMLLAPKIISFFIPKQSSQFSDH